MEDPLPPNPYKTLNVPKDATLATIRSAHRKLVLTCHPDKVQEESAKAIRNEQFHQVQQAYEILSDEKRRQRYDDKVKLDELKAEMAHDRPPPLSRRATDFEYAPPRGAPPPRREMRENIIFETREPRSNRYSDEDYPSPRYAPRTPAKNYDDYYPTSSARRSSGRISEEKKKAREFEDDRDRRRREREAEALAREQRTKKRDKDKRRNTESKSQNKFSAYMDSASDSEADDYYRSRNRDFAPKSRFNEIPLRNRDEPKRTMNYERNLEEEDSDLQTKLFAQAEHMKRMREPVEMEPRRSNARTRAASNLDARPPPTPIAESTKRSSVRRGHSSRQVSPPRQPQKARRSPEIVDPPSSRKPSLPNASSDPKGIKKGGFFSSPIKREPKRAATYQNAPEFKQPQMRRSETAPIDRMQRTEPLRSSNLKNMKAPSDTESSDTDSDSSEEFVTPRRPSLQPKMTSYRVRGGEENNIVLEPKEIYPPKASPQIRRSTDRPAMSPRVSTAQSPSMPRTPSYASPQNERSPRPGYSRTESARPTSSRPHQSSRGDKPLFAEIREEEDMPRRSPKTHQEEGFPFAQQPYSRRGSEDVDRDSYPGSHKYRHHRPYPEHNGTPAY